MSDKRRRIVLEIWVDDIKTVEEYYKELQLSLDKLLDKGVTQWRMHVDLFASERPLVGDKDHPDYGRHLKK